MLGLLFLSSAASHRWDPVIGEQIAMLAMSARRLELRATSCRRHGQELRSAACTLHAVSNARLGTTGIVIVAIA